MLLSDFGQKTVASFLIDQWAINYLKNTALLPDLERNIAATNVNYLQSCTAE